MLGVAPSGVFCNKDMTVDLEQYDIAIAEPLEIAFTVSALFEQYDEDELKDLASNDCCENLYPNVA